ncbi:MAG TPA: 2-C-methyl-D-erythritol 2,4-cyclodiphosphate synthase [bacterium]|nr:2-C-methyl-D-erythritol 2,4-cyclodiphosphate synthase [bacterium]
MSFRIGIGFDVHRFVEGRPLYLGGVEIPHERGLLGHSDADVLLHAVIDAALGAAGVGDIGELFPDSDPRYKGVRSTLLFDEAMRRLRDAGWRVVNCDAVIVCEEPKILPHRAAIRASLAGLLGVPEDAVMVKGKTSEKLGFTGRGEGVAAQAAVLLERR